MVFHSALSCTGANTFISDRDSEIECNLSKFADNTNRKLTSTVYTTEGRGAMKRDLDNLEKLTHKNLMKFNMCKGKVLYLGQEKSQRVQDGRTH